MKWKESLSWAQGPYVLRILEVTMLENAKNHLEAPPLLDIPGLKCLVLTTSLYA